MTFIGVISDTHGLLRPEHAGDVGKPEILKRLREIAPVVAVRCNVDTAPWAEELPETQVVRVVGRSIFVLHDRSKFVADPVTAGYAGGVFGHSHQALVETPRWRSVPQSGQRRTTPIPTPHHRRKATRIDRVA